jgi:hypothetical protein
MSVYAAVSNGTVLRIGPFAEVTQLARQERSRAITVRRATQREESAADTGWAVEVACAGTTDVLRCLDEADARTTAAAVRANGVQARVVRV